MEGPDPGPIGRDERIEVAFGALEAVRRVVRLYFHPLVALVFGGGALMALGAAAATLGRRKEEADA